MHIINRVHIWSLAKEKHEIYLIKICLINRLIRKLKIEGLNRELKDLRIIVFQK